MASIFYTLLLVSILSVNCTADEVVTEEPFGNQLDRIETAINSVQIDVQALKEEKECSYDFCQLLYDWGCNTSGVYRIKPDGKNRTEVYCEHDLADYGPGWTVIQRRLDGTIPFNGVWDDYRRGFGNAGGEFWLGLYHIYHLIANKKAELLVELESGNLKAYAHYSDFSIGDVQDYYKLTISGFTDGLHHPGNALHDNNGMYFSTMDKDNDRDHFTNCAISSNAGWWYKDCGNCDLNAWYGHSFYTWNTWSGHGSNLTASRMMIKTK